MAVSLYEKAYNNNQRFLVALDGTSASGKGLIGSMIAETFSLFYFQSSLVYRGLAYICIKEKQDITDSNSVALLAKTKDIFLEIKDVDLNTEEIASIASTISLIPEVREALSIYLKAIIQNNPRVIMEGRDIGTVIAPEADLKLFITADVQVRAKRRYKQLLLEGKKCMLPDVLDFLKKRDERDQNRKFAPLVPAKDAYIIDTTDLAPHEILQKIKDIVSLSE